MNSAIPSSLEAQHLQRPRRTPACRIRLVLPERHRTVGLGGDEARSAATGAGALPPLEDLVAPAQPHRPRRHRLGGVRGDERRQRLDVVALEGVHVPGQQLALRLVARLVQPGSAACLSRHRGMGPLQRAVDAGDRRVEQLGDLAGLPLQDVAQDQHGALLGRQVLQGGDEGETDRLAFGHGVGRVAGMGRDDVAGRRLDESALGQRRSDEPVGGSRRTRSSPSAGRGAAGRAACRSTRCWRCDRATCAPRSDLRSGRRPARPGSASPARRPRRRTPNRAFGSRSRSARRDAPA